MKILAIVLFFTVSMLTVFPVHSVEDVGITSGQMVVLNIIMHGIVNMYSTNNLIADSYSGGGVEKDSALGALERNRDFLKVLSMYSMNIKRQGAKDDEKMNALLCSVSDICTHLDLQIGAIESYIKKNDDASVTQVRKYRQKLESLIQLMLNSDLGE